MKFQRILSISIFLFATLQASDSVFCPDGINYEGDATEIRLRINCSSCAAYQCPRLFLPSVFTHYGCPEDAFEKCSTQTKAIEFIKDKGENDLEYFDGSMIYASGCENEKDGTKCIAEKAIRFVKIFRKAEKEGYESPLWIGPNGSGSINLTDKWRSVSCPDGEILYGNATAISSRKECFGACAAYHCSVLYQYTHYGCPEDAFEECASYIEAIEFIKSKGENDLEYFDGSMIYASGCGNEKDGTKCIAEKAVRFGEIFHNAEKEGYQSPLWIGPNGSGSINQTDKPNYVSCPDGTIYFGDATSIKIRKNCSSCAAYQCPILLPYTYYGCPEDAFDKCSTHKKAIEFIKSKGENDFEYFDGSMIYASGCENEKDGTKCIAEKAIRFAEIFHKAEKAGYQSPLWIGPNGSGSINQTDKPNYVSCPDGKTMFGNATEISSRKECSKACAAYSCYVLYPSTYYGCPEDAFEKCSGYRGAMEFIKDKGENDLEYYDLQMTLYVSGCGNEIDGTKCIAEKVVGFYETIRRAYTKGFKSPLWNSPQKYLSTARPTREPNPDSTNEYGKPDHDSEDQIDVFRYFVSKSDSDSNNQNCALKWILAIGWMLTTVAWNY